MDMDKVHNEGLEYMDKLPQEIKDIFEKIKELNPEASEPDFNFLARHC